MGPVLKGLVKLQSVENQLRAVKSKLNRSRRKVIFQENQLRSLQNSLKSKKEEMNLTRVQADRLELELKTRDEEISRYRASLNNAKTNKEYASILTQLNTTKADNSKIENQVLELMKDIEADQAECEQIQQQIDQQKQQLEQTRKEAQAQTEKCQQEIDEIQEEWDKAAAEIPSEPLEIFKRLADTYDGEVIANIEEQGQNPTIYTCGSCFMSLPAENINLLMTRDDILRCPNCSRILVLPEQGKEDES